jgi:hypothetical protein
MPGWYSTVPALQEVSGDMFSIMAGALAGERRTKYWMCVPGVNRPSGRIFVPSTVEVWAAGL